MSESSNLMKFFYIVMRDGHIFEIPYTPERIKSAFETWQKKGILLFKDKQAGINGADVTKIIGEDEYENYIDSTKPKLFVRNGIWRDRGGIVRIEPWRQKEIDAKKLPEPKPKELTPAEQKQQKKNIDKIRKDLGKKFKLKK